MAGEFPVDQEINRKISLWEGDLTHLQIDAIVNAAKESLLGGGGGIHCVHRGYYFYEVYELNFPHWLVDGAVHAAAGPELKKECILLKGTKPGTAKITAGYNLPAKR